MEDLILKTFNPHEETARAAREWTRADVFRPQLDEGITTLPAFREAAIGGTRPHDNQFQRTSIENLHNSPYFRDFVTAATRDHGTAAQQAYLVNYPWADLGYEQHAGQNVPPLMPFMPRISGPRTWNEDDLTIGGDLNFPVLGGEALIDYNVRPSDNIYDMTHPLQGDADWDATIKYQASLPKIGDWLRDLLGGGNERSIDDLTIPSEWE